MNQTMCGYIINVALHNLLFKLVRILIHATAWALKGYAAVGNSAG